MPDLLEITLEYSCELGFLELELNLLVFLLNAVEESWERFEVDFRGEVEWIEFKYFGVEADIPSRVLQKLESYLVEVFVLDVG